MNESIGFRALFRGRSIETHEWVYGYIIHYDDADLIDGKQVHPETVGQYVCRDRYDEAIYEGDLVVPPLYRNFETREAVGNTRPAGIITWSTIMLMYVIRVGNIDIPLGDALRHGLKLERTGTIYD